ncbi:MAG: NAD(P)/FAD-dependent oxidoreductase [Lachnospiraceae bacterium]|nr:NAD(P)/FAD-dependent oxidoreductase [Lachnospiraceae bacterium]
MERYDIAIRGTGPAGVSAAITARIRNKKVLLIGDKDISKKMRQAHEINNYPGFPKVQGEDLAHAMSEHLAQMEISITDVKVVNIYAMGKYFSLQTTGETYEALSVIVAAGVMPGKMIEGEEPLVGSGVSYCATCDAPLYRGKDVIVAAYGKEEEKEAAFLAETAHEVVFFPVYNGEPSDLPSNVKVIKEVPAAIRREGNRMVIETSQGRYETDGIFVLRESVSPGALVPGLAADGPHITVDRQMRTNIKGLFACGDITGRPYQYIKAAGEGNVAALFAVEYLDTENRPLCQMKGEMYGKGDQCSTV